MDGVPKVFSRRTLGEFEDAAASIPLRQLDRIFKDAQIPLGEDPGGPAGTRRTQFRRYVASVDQHDPQRLERLGDGLGALIKEVAASKQEFLVTAAERDGFFFADGVFRQAVRAPSAFAITRAEDLALIEDRGRRLYLLANDDPADAIGGAKELVESVCRTVVRLIGEPAPVRAQLVEIAEAALDALALVPAHGDETKAGDSLVRTCLQHLAAVVANLAELGTQYGSNHRRDRKAERLSPRSARLAVGAAVAFAGCVAETYAERTASSPRR
jgi:hypothetical protein